MKAKTRLGLLLAVVCSMAVLSRCSGKDPVKSTVVPAAEPDVTSLAVFTASRILWIAPHPDDELYVAPLIRAFSLQSGKSSVMVVMTRGESGNCRRADGCLPDLVTVRSQELAAAAAYLGTEVRQYDWGDGTAAHTDEVLAAWSAKAGGDSLLVQWMADGITGINPDAILTFDPRHGTSCHADHRATGQLAILGALRSGYPASSVYLVESVPDGTGGFMPVTADTAMEVVSTAVEWDVLTHLLGTIYESQFAADAVAAVSSAPDSARTLSLLRLDRALENDPRYSGICF